MPLTLTMTLLYSAVRRFGGHFTAWAEANFGGCAPYSRKNNNRLGVYVVENPAGTLTMRERERVKNLYAFSLKCEKRTET